MSNLLEHRRHNLFTESFLLNFDCVSKGNYRYEKIFTFPRPFILADIYEKSNAQHSCYRFIDTVQTYAALGVQCQGLLTVHME